MAVHDLRYIRSDGARLQFNDGTIYRLQEEPRGIYNPSTEAHIAAIPFTLPPGVYLFHDHRIRRIEVPLLVRGATPQELTNNLRALWKFLWYDVRQGQRGTLEYTGWNNVRRRIGAVLAEGVDVERWIMGGQNARAAAPVVLPFDCDDPTFYNPTSVTVTGAFDGTTPVELSCTNAGDCDAYPVITYSGAVTNPKVTDPEGRVFEIAGELAAGDELVINTDPRAATVTYTPSGGSATSWWGKFTVASQLVRVPPGTNDLTFEADAGTASITVQFYPRYASFG